MIRKDSPGFEIIDRSGLRHRFGDDLIWQHPSVEGIPDKLDKTIVEVINDDGEVITTFFNQLRVGNVGEDMCLIMPRERRQSECPQCGFCEFIADDDRKT